MMDLMTWSSNTATGVPGSARYDVFHPQDAEVVSREQVHRFRRVADLSLPCRQLRTFLYEQLAKKSHKGLTTATYREIHDE